ncbi:hypothetical protein [Pulveribacter sp.]|uniref:hypothetical protein n=1 Tax=Pulveribacter sp. TaxID=2678893 RepID=UPI0028A6E300|nr:hypothetical protein [Pulveribacter sp.]
MPPPSKQLQTDTQALPVDATALFVALQYQLLVAVEQCHDLMPGECLWIEAMGDVTVPRKTQIEVKHYRDKLTDSHQNFWNTIRNWLHERFDRKSYKSLVLLTTQEFGAQSRLKDWNNLTAVQRLERMQKIGSDGAVAPQTQMEEPAEPEDEAVQTAGTTARKPSKARALQQVVLAPESREALMEVLERMLIIPGEDALPELIDSYKARYLRAIRPSLQQQYLDDLLGFMFSTELVLNGWKISNEAFTAKLTDLHSSYSKHPPEFPFRDLRPLEEKVDLDEIRPMLFARKILEIGDEKQLKRAALHRLFALDTISELLKDQIPINSPLQLYLHNHRSNHFVEREAAILDCDGLRDDAALKKASLRFYLARLKAPTEPFCAMANTMPEFRNGIYHMLADENPKDKEKEFHWKLWE